MSDGQKSGEFARLAERELRYRLLFEGNPLPMWFYDDETLRFLDVNDAAVAHYGWSRDEFLAMTILQIRPAEDLPLVHSLRSVLRGTRNQVPGTMRHRLRNGEIRAVEVVSHGLDWEGRPARFVVATDVTERVAAQEALRDSQARLAGVVSSAMDGIISFDESQRVVLFNAAAERMFGVTEAEALGAPLDRFIPERYRGAHVESMRLFEEYGTTKRPMGSLANLAALRADGSEFPIEATISKVVVGGRRIFTVILRDVTSRRKLEEQLRLSQRLEAVGLLAGGIAHDFNNLLSAIKGYLELLSPAVTDPQGIADLAQVHAAADRAAQLTRQLLTFSRHQVLRPTVVELNDVVRGVRELLHRVIGEDVALHTELHPDTGDVLIDRGQLEQVLMNLAVNARDAMPEGGTLTLVTRRATEREIELRHPGGGESDWTVLEVRDTGIGMDAETIGRAFDPFFTTKTEGRGTGLGLATVRAIADQSNSAVWIESVPGEGTSVMIAFPRVGGSSAAGDDTSSGEGPGRPGDPRRTGAGTLAPPRSKASDGLRVLLVEDDASVRAISTRLLRWRGHAVTAAASGVEGLLRCREALDAGAPFDVLVTDVIMPEMGGRELVRQAREEQPTLAVVYCSGYVGDARADLELDAVAELVQKPFTSDELEEAIRRTHERLRASGQP